MAILQRTALTFLQPDRLQASGLEMVITQAVFAIVGAIALERGGGEANRIVRKQIIGPLGVRAKMGEGSTISRIQ
jgi:large subunit ribosomal protein L15